MLSTLLKTAAAVALCATATNAQQLCSSKPWSLSHASTDYSNEAFAFNQVLNYPMGAWYVDYSATDTPKIPGNAVAACSQDSRVFLIVYGLPNKDCDAGYSNSGYIRTKDDYKKFIQDIVNAVGNRKAMYIVEPDAVGLSATAACAKQNGYLDNVKMALQMLSANANADIYLDVGYWTLQNAKNATAIAKVVKNLEKGGRVKGIALNTSNYRPTKEMVKACTAFQKAYGSKKLNCIIDTSRNYNEKPPNKEWCNARFGGIGHPPTSSTGYANIDQFVWAKPPGESDGTCDDSGRSQESMRGPAAGSFFNDQFVRLWNQGYFVKQQNMKTI